MLIHPIQMNLNQLPIFDFPLLSNINKKTSRNANVKQLAPREPDKRVSILLVRWISNCITFKDTKSWDNCKINANRILSPKYSFVLRAVGALYRTMTEALWESPYCFHDFLALSSSIAMIASHIAQKQDWTDFSQIRVWRPQRQCTAFGAARRGQSLINWTVYFQFDDYPIAFNYFRAHKTLR